MSENKTDLKDKNVDGHKCDENCDHDHNSEPKAEDVEKQKKISEDLQKKINEHLDEVSKAVDFKDYYKAQREVIKNFVGTWKYVEEMLEKDPFEQYSLLIKSFGEKAKLDKEKEDLPKEEQEKISVIEKFNKQILDLFEKKEYNKSSQQLFYVLMGNVLEHIGKADVDMNTFDIQKDLYPHLKLPLSLTFFLFQNISFGPISEKVNGLSKEYLDKYCALFLALWRTIFELMRYEKQVEAQNADKSQMSTDNSDKK